MLLMAALPSADKRLFVVATFTRSMVYSFNAIPIRGEEEGKTKEGNINGVRGRSRKHVGHAGC